MVDASAHQGVHSQAYQLRQKVPHLRHFKHRETREGGTPLKKANMTDRLPECYCPL